MRVVLPLVYVKLLPYCPFGDDSFDLQNAEHWHLVNRPDPARCRLPYASSRSWTPTAIRDGFSELSSG